MLGRSDNNLRIGTVDGTIDVTAACATHLQRGFALRRTTRPHVSILMTGTAAGSLLSTASPAPNLAPNRYICTMQ